MRIPVLLFACMASLSSAIASGSSASTNNERGRAEEHIDRVEGLPPFKIPLGSEIIMHKYINSEAAVNDVVTGTLGQAPIPDLRSYAKVFHGGRRVLSARITGVGYYIKYKTNKRANVKYECAIHGEKEDGTPALFVATLTRAVTGRRWEAGTTYILFVNDENVRFEGEVEEVM